MEERLSVQVSDALEARKNQTTEQAKELAQKNFELLSHQIAEGEIYRSSEDTMVVVTLQSLEPRDEMLKKAHFEALAGMYDEEGIILLDLEWGEILGGALLLVAHLQVKS